MGKDKIQYLSRKQCQKELRKLPGELLPRWTSQSPRLFTRSKRPRFYRPKTKAVARRPKLLRNIASVITKEGRNNVNRIMLQPVTSEKNVVRMEEENTLTYLVPLGVNKVQIKRAAEELWKVKIRTVRTCVRPEGKKKAFIRLAPGSDSLKVASKLGII